MRVYVSCPMSVPQEKLDQVLTHLRSMGHQTRHWARGTTYNEERYIRECDLFVVILPNQVFVSPFSRIPKGTHGELMQAFRDQKPVGVAYWSAEGLAIYSTQSNGTAITGIYGTRDKLIRPAGYAEMEMEDVYEAVAKTQLHRPLPKQLDLFKHSGPSAVLLLKKSS